MITDILYVGFLFPPANDYCQESSPKSHCINNLVDKHLARQLFINHIAIGREPYMCTGLLMCHTPLDDNHHFHRPPPVFVLIIGASG